LYPQQQYPSAPPQPGYVAMTNPTGGATVPVPMPPQAQPPAPQPAAPVMPNVIEPGGGGEWTPKERNLLGRAVMILPTSIDESNNYNGTVRPQVTCDVLVVNVDENGQPLGPITYGENASRNPVEQRPPCFSVDGQIIEFTGMWINSAGIVPTLRNVLAQRGVTLGRIVQGQSAFLLNKLADNDPARAMLIEAWQKRAGGTFKAQPIEINGGPPKKNDGPGQPGAHGGYAPHPGGGMPQHAGAVAMGPQVNYGPPPAAPPPPGGTPPPPPLAAPQGPGPNAQAAGWTPEAFAAAPPHVQQAILAAG
jgi:hypothetical protein